MNNNNHFDLIIIGAGPVGLYGAFYACLNNLSVLILELDNTYGGSPLKLYPDKPIYDFPAIVKINGKQFIDNLYDQLKTKQNWTIKYNQNVRTINRLDDNNFEIINLENESFYAKNVIIAIGYGSFKFKTFSDHIIKLNNKDLIHHYVDNLKRYHQKDLIICGAGNSAIEYCELLHEYAKSINWIHRSNKICGFESNAKQLCESSKICKYLNYEITEINNDYMIIKNNENPQELKQLKYDFILAFYGTELISSHIYETKIWNNKRKIEVNEWYESVLMQGLYACGKCNDKPYNNLLLNGMSQITIAIDHLKGNKNSH